MELTDKVVCTIEEGGRREAMVIGLARLEESVQKPAYPNVAH